jgi:hypothetical protein
MVTRHGLSWLSKQQTFPSITQLFIARLMAWRNRQEVTFPEPGLDFLATAYREQTNIGWYNFLQGRVCNNYWVKIQSAYYKKLKSRCTSHKWAQNLIHRLWDISWNMWKNCDNILDNVHTNFHHNRLSQKLDKCLLKESSININGLTPIHHYMVRRTSLALLLLWNNAEKSAWLATIKIARIAWKHKIRQSRQQRQML